MSEQTGHVPSWDETLSQALRSLNDVVSELVCGLAMGDTPSKGYAFTVVKTLAAQTRALGGDPSIDVGALDGWERET